MTHLLALPPPPEAIAAMLAIPRTQIAPTILATQQGPDGDLGPESAGAILVLQATFTDPEGASGFWTAAVDLMRAAGVGAWLHPALQLPRRTEHHVDRPLADGCRRESIRRDARTPRRGPRPLRPPVAVQPLLRDLGDDLEPRSGGVLRPLRRDHGRLRSGVQRLWHAAPRRLPTLGSRRRDPVQHGRHVAPVARAPARSGPPPRVVRG